MAEKIIPGTIVAARSYDNMFPFDSDRKMMSVVANGEVLVK